MSASNEFSLGLSYVSVGQEKQSSMKTIQLVNPEYCSIAFLRIPKKPHITMKSFEDLIKPTPFKKTDSKGGLLTKSSIEPGSNCKSLDLNSGLNIRRRAESSSPALNKKILEKSSTCKRIEKNYTMLRTCIPSKSHFAEESAKC